MIRSINKDAYLGAVAEKLGSAQQFLAHGTMGKSMGLIRNAEGLQVTNSNILTVAENLCDVAKNDSLADHIANFSGTGYADVANVATVGAIDVTIAVQANSLVPFLCVDRAMANPVDTIYYMNLTATNNAGGLEIGDVANGNFTAPNNSIVLQAPTPSMSSESGASTLTANFATQVMPGTIKVEALDAEGKVVATGQDFGKDGKIYFNNTSAAGTSLNLTVITGTVVYTGNNAGTVTVNVTGEGIDKVQVTVMSDPTWDSEGANILKVKQDWVNQQLVTTPVNIILELNAHSSAYMAKIAAKAERVSGTVDYQTMAFDKVNQIYVENINRMVIKALVLTELSSGVAPLELNLTSYGVDSFSMTKDDLVNQFIIGMRTQFLARTGVQPTVIVTGTRGAALLESNKDKWIPSPTFYTQQNGLAGTFNGIPVYRHNYLDVFGYAPTDTDISKKANFFMACKLPDNSAGTLAFGEYLPLIQTAMTGNYQNPIQSSVGFFSQVGVQPINNGLVQKGVVTLA